MTRTVDICRDGGCGVPSQTSHCEGPKIVSVSCFYRLTAERLGPAVSSPSLSLRLQVIYNAMRAEKRKGQQTGRRREGEAREREPRWESSESSTSNEKQRKRERQREREKEDWSGPARAPGARRRVRQSLGESRKCNTVSTPFERAPLRNKSFHLVLADRVPRSHGHRGYRKSRRSKRTRGTAALCRLDECPARAKPSILWPA